MNVCMYELTENFKSILQIYNYRLKPEETRLSTNFLLLFVLPLSADFALIDRSNGNYPETRASSLTEPHCKIIKLTRDYERLKFDN